MLSTVINGLLIITWLDVSYITCLSRGDMESPTPYKLVIRYLLYLLDTILGHLPINPRNLLYFELLISEDCVKYCPYDLWQHVWQYVWLICIYYVVPIGGMIGKIIHKQFWTCAVSFQPTQSTHVIKAVMTKLFLPFTHVKKNVIPTGQGSQWK